MTYAEIISAARTLSPAQRRTLIHILVDSLQSAADEEKVYDILEFEGAGQELYDGTDAQAYVNQLRSEWDHRP